MTEQAAPRQTPFSMTFVVWYRRVFLWGLSLMFLPASVQAWIVSFQDLAGEPLSLVEVAVLAAMLAVCWAIIAVLVTLCVVGLASLADRKTAPGTGKTGFSARFYPWYRRIFLWGPGLLFFVLALRAWFAGVSSGNAFEALTPLLVQMVILSVMWAVAAVLVTLIALGLWRAVGRAGKGSD